MLKVGIKTTAFEEPIAQKEHPLVGVIAHCRHVDQPLPVPDAVTDLHILFYGAELSAVVILDTHDVFGELAVVIIDDEYVFLLDLDGVNNAGEGECDVCFQRREVDCFAVFNAQTTHFPLMYAIVHALGDEEALADTTAAGAALPPDKSFAAADKAVLVEVIAHVCG